jgi:mRNA interferase HicA
LKRRDLIREIAGKGCFLKRNGSNHDIYQNGNNGRKAPIPRHSEVKESLAREIKKQLGLA